MKTQIRFGTFETNSSSTHSITITSKDQFDKWVRGECYFQYKNNKFVSIEEGNKLRNEHAIIDGDEVVFDDYYSIPVTYQEWFRELTGSNETYAQSQKIGNIEVTAFGYYGYD